MEIKKRMEGDERKEASKEMRVRKNGGVRKEGGVEKKEMKGRIGGKKGGRGKQCFEQFNIF